MQDLTERTCRHCNGAITTPNGGRGEWQRFCSTSCREQAKAETRRSWRESLGFCEIDGCQGRKRSATTPWCEMHYRRNHRHGSPHATQFRSPNGTCHHCGAKAKRQRLYCSESCRKRSRVGIEGPSSECVVCFGVIPPDVRSHSLYCSLECQRLQERGKRYGVTGAEMMRLVSEYEACAICGEGDSELVVDHCHTHGHIRGLLCGQCNVGLGMLKDDPVRLTNAIEYLQHTKPKSHNPLGTS